jgi:hypothetical protein
LSFPLVVGGLTAISGHRWLARNQVESLRISHRFYIHAVVDAAYTKHLSSKIIFNRVVFQLLQIDQNSYNYIMITHSYHDPYSIRLDEPVLSNAAGGIGMVGCYTLDSVTHDLPENFVSNRR